MATVLAVDGFWCTVALRSTCDHSTVDAWWRAVRHFLATGDAYLLVRLRGRRLGGVALATELAVVEAAARRGPVP